MIARGAFSRDVAMCLLLRACVAVIGAMIPRVHAAADGSPSRPNVIVIVADDLGYGEVGCYGGRDAPTPNLDAMAQAGVRCTAGYVTCPVCSPTRAALLIGRYQQRFGHEFNIPQSFELKQPELYGLPLDEQTLADRMKARGYRTAAIGKWHLGVHDRYHPQARGFDEFFGFLDGGRPYFADGHPDNFYYRSVPPHDTVRPRVGSRSPVLRGREPVQEAEYLTDAFTREAVRFIDESRTAPFFLYVAYNAAHTPITPCKRWAEKLAHIESPIRRTVASMVAGMDEGIGAIRDRLQAHGIAENTLVIFLSDNGGSPGGKQANAEHYSLNTPLRGAKGECHEGGIRVPYLIEWPARIPAGQIFDRPVSSLDVVPTALVAAGAAVPDDADGTDLLPYLAGGDAGRPHESLFWRFGAWKAVRQGDMKLVKRRGEPDELYDLARDMTESRDLAGDRPELVADLNAALAAWERGLVEPQWTGQGPRVRSTAPDFVATQPPRNWGDSFVPTSPPPATVMSAVSLEGLPAAERIAVTCLQGLLAREQPRLFLVRNEADDRFWMDWYVAKGHVERFETVADWTMLLDQHRGLVKGAVVADPELYRGDVLALNVAACEDLLVATPQLAERLGLPVKFDLRGRFATYAEGLEWLWATYKDRLNPHLCDLRHPRLLPHGTFDHAFQWRGLMLWLAGPKEDREPGVDRPAELAVVSRILAAMPANGVCLGFPALADEEGLGEPEGVKLLSRYGKVLMPTNHGANYSFSSAVRIERLEQPAPPPPPALDRDTIYIALTLSDGDNQILWPKFFRRYVEHPAFGTFPLALGMGPAIRELQPAVAQWYFEKATPRTELFADVSGAGYINPDHFATAYRNQDEVWAGYLNWTRRLMEPLGQRTIRTVKGSDEPIARYARALPFCHGIVADMGRYSGREGIATLTYSLPDGMPVFRAVTSWRHGKEGFLPEIREQVGDVRPAFVNGFVHCWTFTMDDLVRIHAHRDPDMVFVTPSQLAELYRQARSRDESE